MAGGYKLSFLSGERTVVDNKIHGDCRLRNLLERNVRGADGIPDMDVRDAGNGNNRSGICLGNINFV